jgi:hypothetical protein
MRFDHDVEAIDYSQYGAEAERLAAEIESAGNSYEPVYKSLDATIAGIEAEGEKPSDLLPADAEPGLGFSLNEKRDGKTLWRAIAISSRRSLCDPDSDLRKQLSGNSGTSAGALVTLIMTALGLSVLAIGLAVALAGVITAIGLPAFCEWSTGTPDELAAD